MGRGVNARREGADDAGSPPGIGGVGGV